jgi:hypothetical protein
MGLILMPRLGTAVVVRKIDRLSSRRAYFETRWQEANAPFNGQQDNPMQEDYLLRQEDLAEKLSRSVSRASQSTPGDAVALDIKGIKAWAQV